MSLSEADTRAKLIDPAIHARGWSEDLICREVTLGAVEIVNGKGRRRSSGRTDYTLRIRVNTETQPVALALIEAKKESLPPGHGLDQAKGYLAASRHNVQFVFSSNGHLFVEFDRSTGLTTAPRPIAEFPTPAELRARYETIVGFSLDAPAALNVLAKTPRLNTGALQVNWLFGVDQAAMVACACSPHGPRSPVGETQRIHT